MKKPLTKRQQAIYDFINSYFHKFGLSPSYQEIGEHFNFARNAARCHVAAIVDAGWLDREEGKARSIRIVGMTEVPSDWLKRVLSYLEGGLESEGPLEEAHSIEARSLIREAKEFRL